MTAAGTESLELYVVHNEVDPDCAYHCEALASQVPAGKDLDFVAGDRVPDDADAVILTGSTAGVYERDRHQWIAEQERLVRDLVDREIPTLGVCFGHQLANTALGGTVEYVGTTATLVEATLADDPLFAGVDPVVATLHGDVVTEAGDEMEIIASADHARVFGTRHRTAPLWTVQFHPELTADHRPRLVADFGWETDRLSFGDVTADRIFENFERIAASWHTEGET